MSLPIRRCLKRSRLVEELYENWVLDHREAMFACDVEELAGECVELCRLFRHAWTFLKNQLFSGIDDTETTGRLFHAAVKRSADVVGRVVALAEDAEKRGYRINQSGDLRQGLAELRELDAELAHHWPFIDHDMIAQARAAYGRGEFQTAEELLHAAQGGGAEAD